MDDEISDILGQRTKVVRRGNAMEPWLGVSLTTKLALGLAILLVLYAVVMRIWIRVLVWKERSYKLAMRRRHGIPDNDHRPFNVAYAAVVRARQEKEAAQKAKAKATQPLPPHDRRNAQPEQDLRQRFGVQTLTDVPRASSYSARFPGAYYAPEGTPAGSGPHHSGSSMRPASPLIPPLDSPQPQHTQQVGNGALSHQNGHRRSSRKELAVGEKSSSQKRGFAEDQSNEQEIIKRSKFENGQTGNEADGMVWRGQGQAQRGAKRNFGSEDEDEDDILERQPRDKRARKVSSEKGIQVREEDSEMDVDEGEEDDDIDDLPSFRRGKKRDRAEAGSTFGGDDDWSNSDLDNSELNAKRRTRKRRTVSNRYSGLVPTRGQKRDRTSEDESAVESDDDIPYSSRKKRGKKASLHDTGSSEQTTSDSRASSTSRNRKIGEEWSSNGINWKVGPNGQRLRQALVKRARQKFPMPEDSQHPDRDLDFEVFVETWLTDEEYRDAKAQHILAWQDSPKRYGDVGGLAVDIQSPAFGKSLLWSSTSTPVGSPVNYSPSSDYSLSVPQRVQRDPFRSSVTSAVGLRINPFDQPSAQIGRRISSLARSTSVGNIGSPSLTDSTNSSPHSRFKVYSKFEKQELEAQAILRLRELKSKKEAEANKAKEDQEKAEKERIEKENLDQVKVAASPAIPTITVTAPTEALRLQSTALPPASSESASDPSKHANAPKPSEPLVPSATSPFIPATSTSVTPKPGDKPAPTPSIIPTFSAPPAAISSMATSNTSASNFLGASPAVAPTTGSGSGSTSEQPIKPPTMFSFPSSASIITNAPGAPAAQPGTAKPLFSFGGIAPKQSAEQKISETTEVSRPALQPASGNSLLTRLGPSSQPTTSFSFPKPAAQSNLFGPPTTPAKTPQPASTTSAAPLDPNTTTTPKFSFGFTNPTGTASATTPIPGPVTSPSQTGQRAKPTSQPLVNFVPLTQTNETKDGNKFATNGAAYAAQPLFGFKAPATTTTATGPTSTTMPGVSSSAPQFSFAAPSGTSSTTSSNLFGAPSAMSASGMGTLGKPAETQSADQSGTRPTKPLFSFGGAQGQHPSGTIPASGFLNTTAAKPSPSSSSLFGALGPRSMNLTGVASTSSTSMNLGVPSASSTAGGTLSTLPVGVAAPTTQSVSGITDPSGSVSTGGSSNLLGVTANKPSEVFKTTFPFASPMAVNGSEPTKSADTPKPLFNFSTKDTTGPPSSTGVTPFTFNFGAANKNSTSSTIPQTSLFGAASAGTPLAFAAKPVSFTFGATPSTTGAASGSSGFGGFGAVPSTTQQK